MRKLIAVSLFLVLILSLVGCGITIIPRPHDPADKINNSDRSITIKRAALTLSARVQDTAVGGYSFETPLTSFYVVAENHSSSSIIFPLSSFNLVDDQGKKYPAVPPASVNATLLPESQFLVPFPYVSFLDVVAQENQRASSAMQSEQPYVRPGFDLDPIGIPFEPTIAAGARGAGAVFFEVDLYLVKSISLRVDAPSDQATYIFPFSIEK